ncbi:TonB-dependent receptor [Sphingomonadales bacterium EhC05]|nr:TonB-dependent receptor [Sphingomonadales bacterium EhC05]
MLHTNRVNHRRGRQSLLAGCAFCVIAAASPNVATAQERETEQSDDNVIIVTAQKREQSVLDVGINISVADSEALTNRRIDAATDIVTIAPNISIKENVPGLVPVITIRGVGLNDFSATNNPSAGVYVDEVSLSSLALMNFDFFDLDRIEVLKGPQGTLYGRTATAGALNVVTAKPDFRGVSGMVRASLSNYETKEAEAMINLPAGDTLSFRFAGKGIFQDEGFYFDETLGRDIGRREVLLGRAQALWEPSDNFSILLKAEVQQGRSELGGAEFFGAIPNALTPAGVTCPGAPECSDFLGYQDLDGDPFRGAYSVDPSYNFDQLALTAKIEADLGFATLTSITGYIDFDRQWSADTDAGPLAQLDFRTNDDVKQFSQEIRLSGEAGPANWLIGAFYSEDEIFTSYDGNLSALLNTTTFSFSDQESESAAIFANAEWAVSDALSLITGLRYTDENRSNVGGTTDLVSLAPASFLSMAPFGSDPVPIAVSNDTISDTNWSWKLGLNWEAGDDTLIYASATQGWKSGGFFAGVAVSSSQLLPYQPEKLVAYELGIKGKVRSADLTYSVSGFYYDYSDVQTFIREDIGGLPVQRLGNVDQAEIFGLDLDLLWRPAAIQGLTLNAGLGLLETKLGSFLAGAGPVPAGNDLPDAPSLSFNGGVTYEFDVSDTVQARFALNSRYQSSVYKDALNDTLIEADGFWVLDGRASIFTDNNWDVSVWGKNITDKRYVTQGINQTSSFGLGFRVYGAPATYGITLTKHFN